MMATLNMVKALNSTLRHAMEKDERVVILGEDVGRNGGVFRVTDGLQARFGAQRVLDTPLAESGIIGAAVGMSLAGLRPVPEIQFLGFSHQGFHQIGSQIGRYRFRSRGRHSAQVTIRAPFGGGVRTPEFHPDSIEAQFVQEPGIKVVCPVTPYDAKGMLLEAIRDPDPVLFLEPQRLYRATREEVPDGEYTVPFGRARLARGGDDVVLIAWSAAVELCLRVATILDADGVSAAVLDLRSLVPLDVESIVAAVVRTGKAVVVHEASLTGGFGAEIVATIQQEAFYSLDAPVARVASWDIPYPPGALEDHYLPSAERVRAAVRKVVEA